MRAVLGAGDRGVALPAQEDAVRRLVKDVAQLGAAGADVAEGRVVEVRLVVNSYKGGVELVLGGVGEVEEELEVSG